MSRFSQRLRHPSSPSFCAVWRLLRKVATVRRRATIPHPRHLICSFSCGTALSPVISSAGLRLAVGLVALVRRLGLRTDLNDSEPIAARGQCGGPPSPGSFRSAPSSHAWFSLGRCRLCCLTPRHVLLSVRSHLAVGLVALVRRFGLRTDPNGSEPIAGCRTVLGAALTGRARLDRGNNGPSRASRRRAGRGHLLIAALLRGLSASRSSRHAPAHAPVCTDAKACPIWTFVHSRSGLTGRDSQDSTACVTGSSAE